LIDNHRYWVSVLGVGSCPVLGLALIGQSGSGQRGDLFGQARLLRTRNSLTGASPSTLHQCRLLLCLSSRPPFPPAARPSTPLTQLCFFQSISIDARRRRDNEKKMASTKRPATMNPAGRSFA